MSEEKTLGDGGSNLGRYDTVDFFGLDDMGEPFGLSPIYGGMVGSGVGTIASIWARSSPSLGAKSELIGLGAGLAVGAAMVAFPSTRYSGWVAMASAVLNNGLRAAEWAFKTAPAAATTTQGALGRYSVSALNSAAGLGVYTAKSLNGPPQAQLLGAPTTQAAMARNYGSTYLNR